MQDRMTNLQRRNAGMPMLTWRQVWDDDLPDPTAEQVEAMDALEGHGYRFVVFGVNAGNVVMEGRQDRASIDLDGSFSIHRARVS